MSTPSDLGFLRQDIGLAILGTLIANVGLGLYAVTEADGLAELFRVAAGAGGLVAVIALWHLGWRLAFPGPVLRSPLAIVLVTTLGGLLAGLAIIAAAFAG